MAGFKTLDADLSSRQDDWATFLAIVAGVLVCAAMILFGIFVWDKALLHRSHSRWHTTTGHVVNPGAVGSAGGFEAYEEATVRYVDWKGVSRTASVALPVGQRKGSAVSMCIRRTGQKFVPSEYGNQGEGAPKNPCNPSQKGPIIGSIPIGIVLGGVMGMLAYLVIGNLILQLTGIADGWTGRKVRAAKLRLLVAYRCSLLFRVLHGRRPQYSLTRAQAFLAELEGMKPTPRVEELRGKTRTLIGELKESGKRKKVDRATEIDSQLEEISVRFDRERTEAAAAETQSREEMAQRELG